MPDDQPDLEALIAALRGEVAALRGMVADAEQREVRLQATADVLHTILAQIHAGTAPPSLDLRGAVHLPGGNA